MKAEPINKLQTYTAGGADLHYLKTGSGSPVIFIPGNISDYRTWTPTYPAVSDHHTCYVLSRRFQYPGQYVAGGDGSVAANATDIISFIKNENLAPAILVGHSYGGFIALQIAATAPELVKAVVVEEPIFTPALMRKKSLWGIVSLFMHNGEAGQSFAKLGQEGIEPAFKALKAGDTVTAQIAIIRGLTAGAKTPDTLDDLTRQQLQDNMSSLAGEDAFNHHVRMEIVKNIQAQTLLIGGSDSLPMFRYINQRLHSLLPNATLQTIPHAGHWVHIDQPQQYNAALQEFLKSV